MIKTPVKPLIIICLVFLLGGCGYYFPNVYNGPEKSVYMPTWKNRTDRLGIDNAMYQSLSVWFQKSDKINLTKDKENADLVLAGEIIFIDLPSVGWDSDARTTDIKARLGLRYVLKDLETGKILWEVPDDVYSEDVNTLNEEANNETEAIDQMLTDISEKIYLGTMSRVRAQNNKK